MSEAATLARADRPASPNSLRESWLGRMGPQPGAGVLPRSRKAGSSSATPPSPENSAGPRRAARACPSPNACHPDDVAALQDRLRPAGAPAPESARTHRWLTPQGWRWFTWEETPLPARRGRVPGIRAVGRDITRQRLAEELYLKLSRAVDQSPVSIVITDADGRVQYVNPQVHQDFRLLPGGHPRPQPRRSCATGTPTRSPTSSSGPRSAPAGNGRANFPASARRERDLGIGPGLLHAQPGRRDHQSALHAGGHHRPPPPGGRAAPGPEDGEPGHPGRRHRARFQQPARGDERLRRHQPAASRGPGLLQKSLREIKRAVQRAGGLVRQILTFSRKAEVHFAPMDLNQLVRELVALLAETFPRTVNFGMVLHSGLPPLVADHNQLQQIVLNLCVNARDAMPAGGTITLTTTCIPGQHARPSRRRARPALCLPAGERHGHRA